MNRWVVLTSVAGLAGAAWLFGGHEPPSPPPAGDRPWEVTLAPDGSSRALGLTLGRSTLGDAIARFGKGVDVAMFESAGRPLSLEAYFAAGSSPRHAAGELHVHPNTLDYRLKRVVELTGLEPATTKGLQLLAGAVAVRRLNG